MNHDEHHEMAHEKAIADLTAERYLLGELSDADADAFEKHYFDCHVCADTIRAGAAMFVAGREVALGAEPTFPVAELDHPTPKPMPRPLTFRQRFQQALPLAAAAVLAVVVGYQGLFIRSIRMAGMEALTPGDVITGPMRASESEDYVMRFVGNRARVDYVDITDLSYPEYRIELRNASGKLVLRTEATVEEARSETGVPLLIRPLPAGRYLLTIEGVPKGGNRTEIGRRNVVVQ
ncbi:MAG TPA: hypothetical protein VFV49_10905 [Thermoanaerobaculia bacterium]|nr:hypothetical protein [Thermoanaerobaculia bacterium]